MGQGYDHNWIIRDEPVQVEMKKGMFGFDPHCPIDRATPIVAVRGGSWSDSPGFVGSTFRQGATATGVTPSYGVRCAKSE